MKLFLKAIFTLVFIFNALGASAADLSAKEQAAIVVLCKQLLADYAIYRDHLDADGFANTFTEDATVVLGSGTYRGRDEIRKNITDRPYPAIAHMVFFTTSQITPISATQATGLSNALILNGDRPVLPGDAAIQMNGITAASEYRTNFELTDEGWKISHLELSVMFRGSGYVQ